MSDYTGMDPEVAWARIEAKVAAILDEGNRSTVLRFLRRRKMQGVALATLGAHAHQISAYCIHLGDKPLLEATPEDVEDFFFDLPDSVGQATRSNYFIDVRTMYRHLTQEREPPQIGSFKIQRPKAKQLRPQDLVDADDLRKILAVCDPMERCVVMVLFDVGFRNGELRSLNVGSVALEDGEIVLHLPPDASGLKTGARSCLAFDSEPYIRDWLNRHQVLEDPRAPLFYYRGHGGVRKRINEGWMSYFMDRINERAGLEKHVWPHLFRHTSATNMARRGVQESVMRTHYGWTPDSDMPTVYVHLAQDDCMDVLRAAHGRAPRGKRRALGFSVRACPHCGVENLPDTLFCTECRRAMDPAAAGALEARRAEGLREELARMVGHLVKEEMAQEVRALLERGGGGGYMDGSPAP